MIVLFVVAVGDSGTKKKLFSTLSLYTTIANRSPSSPCRPERNPEVDRLSSVYDNDFLVEMSRPSEALRRNSNRTVPKGGGRILAKSEV